MSDQQNVPAYHHQRDRARDTLIDEITALGALGYTITDVRGRGNHGLRSGNWRKDSNIRLEVVGDQALCDRIVAPQRGLRSRLRAADVHCAGRVAELTFPAVRP
jgi:hypothetical protein